VKKQTLVVGLGQFGMSLARSLAERGAEVIAVDARTERVQIASRFAGQALCVDATEDGALERLAPARRDICVCAIGNEAREGAIIVTAILRQLGARFVVARAADDLTRRILTLVGAHEVVNPERAFGERLATRLIYDEILDELPLGPDLVITNLRPAQSMVGRNLIELALPRRFGLTVVAVRQGDADGAAITQPDPSRPLRTDDTLIVVSRPGAVQKLAGSW
jgi:trk system potassium uptake protein TrkA